MNDVDMVQRTGYWIVNRRCFCNKEFSNREKKDRKYNHRLDRAKATHEAEKVPLD